MKRIDLEELVIIEESVDNWSGFLCFGPGAQGYICGFACQGYGWCW